MNSKTPSPHQEGKPRGLRVRAGLYLLALALLTPLVVTAAPPPAAADLCATAGFCGQRISLNDPPRQSTTTQTASQTSQSNTSGQQNSGPLVCNASTERSCEAARQYRGASPETEAFFRLRCWDCGVQYIGAQSRCASYVQQRPMMPQCQRWVYVRGNPVLRGQCTLNWVEMPLTYCASHGLIPGYQSFIV